MKLHLKHFFLVWGRIWLSFGASDRSWQSSLGSRMSWSHPSRSSAGHINPAGLRLYGSPAHTSVMRVNKQRAKGQLSPQNKRGNKGKKRWEERIAAPGAVFRSLSGLQAGDDVWDDSHEPEIIINREQGWGVFEERVALSLSGSFLGSDSKTWSEKRNHDWLMGGLITLSLFASASAEEQSEMPVIFPSCLTCSFEWQMRVIKDMRHYC